MSSLQNRFAARVLAAETAGLSIVPSEIRARYAEAMAQIPRVRLSIRFARRSADLPAVGSFG